MVLNYPPGLLFYTNASEVVRVQIFFALIKWGTEPQAPDIRKQSEQQMLRHNLSTGFSHLFFLNISALLQSQKFKILWRKFGMSCRYNQTCLLPIGNITSNSSSECPKLFSMVGTVESLWDCLLSHMHSESQEALYCLTFVLALIILRLYCCSGVLWWSLYTLLCLHI